MTRLTAGGRKYVNTLVEQILPTNGFKFSLAQALQAIQGSRDFISVGSQELAERARKGHLVAIIMAGNAMLLLPSCQERAYVVAIVVPCQEDVQGSFIMSCACRKDGI